MINQISVNYKKTIGPKILK